MAASKDIARGWSPLGAAAARRRGALVGPRVDRRAAVEHQRHEIGTAQPLLDPLTARELEILRLMFGGHSNREIADACGVAVLRALEIGLL